MSTLDTGYAPRAIAASQTGAIAKVYRIRRVNSRAIRGTILNVATVLAGGLVGLALGGGLSPDYKVIAQSAIGIGTMALGLKMFLTSSNALIPIGSLIFGGLLGHLLGFQAGMDSFGAWAKNAFGGGEGFQYSFVASSILFCVGPMTLLGCLEDGLEGKINLLGIKSALDGISSLFFAAAYGPGVLLSAATVLVVQAPLTLGARRLQFLAEKRELLDEITGTGGLILVAIGLGLTQLKALPTADFLPALIFAGVAARFSPQSKQADRSQPL